MDETTAVGVVEATRRLEAHQVGLRRIEASTGVEHGPQRPPAEQLGDQVGHVALPPVVHRHDVRVVERRRSLRLGLEPLQEGGIVGEGGVQDLDRHASTQHDVVGEVDGGRGTGADGAEQPVAATEHLAHTVTHPGNRHQERLLVTRV